MQKQNGNALWFILIAIGLLGLLTASLTRSGSSTNETGSFEQNQIAASQILTYAKSIENAVQSLLARGCSENEISFENNVITGYANTNSPTDNSCHVFEPEGTGLEWETPKSNNFNNAHSSETHYGDWFITGNVHLNGFGNEAPLTPACGTNCTELILSLNFINRGLCNSINRSTSHGKADGSPIIDAGASVADSTHTKFTGGFLGTHEMGTANPSSDNYDGKQTGCIEVETSPASGSYTFYHVLHAR